MTRSYSLLAIVFLRLASACHGSQPEVGPPRAVDHATLAIINVRVFDGERVMQGSDVLVDGATIVAVGRGLKVPAGVETVEGAGRTLLPGLIDAHVHVFDGSQLEQAVAFGVTTVLDMFSRPDRTRPLRAENRPDRADLRSAGILATAPHGHGTEYGFARACTTSSSSSWATWAGALFSPGARPFSPADLSARRQLSFQAKGDGKTYEVMVFARSRGRFPVRRSFQPGKDFARVTFAWSDFDGLTGNDVMGIFIGQSQPGPFRLVIDDVALQ